MSPGGTGDGHVQLNLCFIADSLIEERIGNDKS